MAADPSDRRLHLWTVLILSAVFAAGAATGAGLGWALAHRGPMPPPHGPGPGRGPGAPRELPPFLADVGLTPEQASRARAILESHRPEIEAAVAESFPRVRAVRERALQEIRAILTPEQAARLDAAQARMPTDLGPPPPMGPPPGAPPR